jgi:hypothetical protein
MGSFVPSATIILVAFKGICCCRRALLWNRRASIILDLVLSVCVFTACGGKASAQSHYESSTGSADYAMKLGEDALLKIEPKVITLPTKSVFPGGAKALPEMIGELTRHLKGRANYYRLGHRRMTFRKVNRYARRCVQRHPRWRSQDPRYVTGPSLMGRDAALSGGPGRYPWSLGIITTIFLIGERPRGHNPMPNVRSSWDKYWYRSMGWIGCYPECDGIQELQGVGSADDGAQEDHRLQVG